MKEPAASRSARPLSALVETLGAACLPLEGSELLIHRIVRDSRQVQPGDLFVAIRGTSADGHDAIPDAVANGAAAVVVEREVGDPGVPLVRVENSRRAWAELAAAWYGHPARRLPLVGITGTLGKTSVLTMLEAILTEAGRRAGTIGSLGIRFSGEVEETGHTVPDALVLQRALARMIEGGAELAMMEATSHALSQERLHGLSFALGIFTNLVPLEHMEYHGSFEEYVKVKSLFFDHLRPGAPVVYAAGDRVVAALLEERGLPGIGCGAGDDVHVQIRRLGMDTERTRLSLRVQRPLPRLDGGQVEPSEFPLELQLLGRSHVTNAALAGTAALCLGADADAVQRALGAFPPPRRRMEILHRGRFTVLDDTVGHPDSISAVFEVAEQLPHRGIHAVVVVRGQRGEEINQRSASAIAIWTERVPLVSLIVTRSREAADERNRVEPAEHAAFTGRLRQDGCHFEEHERLEDAVRAVLERAGEGDLVLLLGAQGMDAGARIVRRWLEEHGEAA
ncbi:MAG TPA: Mur ligase family protein [Longimicrobiaceae bacterium]|nr:Mur ligase family protein [Longimicrobiaceae bacterium]